MRTNTPNQSKRRTFSRATASLASAAVLLQTGSCGVIDYELWRYQWLDFLRTLLVEFLDTQFFA